MWNTSILSIYWMYVWQLDDNNNDDVDVDFDDSLDNDDDDEIIDVDDDKNIRQWFVDFLKANAFSLVIFVLFMAFTNDIVVAAWLVGWLAGWLLVQRLFGWMLDSLTMK